MRKIITTALLVALVGSARAHNMEVDGIYYDILTATTCEVTYNGDDVDYHGEPNYGSYSGEVIVPQEVSYGTATYTVVGIGTRAFYSSKIETLTLPESITYIGDYGISSCSRLTEIAIPTTVDSIGERAFSSSTGLTGSIALPASVHSIGVRAFYNCTNLSNIEVNEDNTTYCSINGVLYTKDLTELLVCPSANALTTIALPSSLTTIDDYAFYDCDNLETIDIPESVTSLGEYAFTTCDALTSAHLAGGIATLGDCTFSRCVNLVDVVLSEGLESIGTSCFYHCESLPSITLPTSLTTVGRSAFRYCYALTEITFPSVTTINTYTCADCTSLTEVVVGNSTTAIEDYAFYNSTAIMEVTLGSSLASIGSSAFTAYADDQGVRIYSMNPSAPRCSSSAIEVAVNISRLYVPEGSESTYSSMSIWSNFATWGSVYTYVAQKVETLAADSITHKSATLTSNVTVGSQPIKEYGFEYWTADGDVLVVSSSLPSATITGLEAETEYTYRAFATNPASGTVYGDAMTFTTAVLDGINGIHISLDSENVVGIYSVGGQKIEAPQKGVNIIRYTDGTVKKIYVK